MSALQLDKSRGSLFQRLVRRSCWVMVGMIVLICAFSSIHTKEFGCDSNGAFGRLRHVLVLHRHGARSPVHWYDFEGTYPWAKWDVGLGKLTVQGMLQGFNLGRELQRSYGHLLSGTAACADAPGTSPTGVERAAEAVVVHSTDYDRTVDTANAVLLGLLSPLDSAASAEEPLCGCRPRHGQRSEPSCVASCLGIKPVPGLPSVDVVPKTGKRADVAKHYGLYQASECDAWDKWRNVTEASERWLAWPGQHLPQAVNLVKEMVNGTQVRKKDWPSGEYQPHPLNLREDKFNMLAFMETVWGDLVCYNTAGWPYMEGLGMDNQELLSVLQPVADYVWKDRYGTPRGAQTGGVLLETWIKELESAASRLMQCEGTDGHYCDDTGNQMTIFSAHDTTVFSLMAAMGEAGSARIHVPRFTSHVIMELWQPRNMEATEDGMIVRVLYDGKELPMALFKCSKRYCTLKELAERACSQNRAMSTCRLPSEA